MGRVKPFSIDDCMLKVEYLQDNIISLQERVSGLEKDCYTYTYYEWGERGKKITPVQLIGLILHHFGLSIKHYPSKEILEVVVEKDELETDKKDGG